MQRHHHHKSWTVELVHPPGALVVRSVDKQLSSSEAQQLMTVGLSRIPIRGPWDGTSDLTDDPITQEVAEEHQENLKIHRWVLFCCPYESLAQKMSDQLATVDGIGTVPWAENVMRDVTSVFRHLQDAIDAKKKR